MVSDGQSDEIENARKSKWIEIVYLPFTRNRNTKNAVQLSVYFKKPLDLPQLKIKLNLQ